MDIEEQIEEGRARRIEERFLSEISAEILSADKESPLPCPAVRDSSVSVSEIADNLTTTDKWVLCEATLKCEGGGFGSFSEIATHVKQTSARLFRVNNGEREYSLAVSVKKK